MQNFNLFRKVSRPVFMAALEKAKRERGDQGLCVSAPEEGAALYLSADGLSGYALDAGAFGSVFSMAKGRLGLMVRDAKMRARREGASMLLIDCFEPLAAVYARHGFQEASRVKFDWQYAPEGWASRHGEPDVIFMALPVEQAALAA